MEKRTVGSFISVLRKSKGWTQKELGEMLGVSDKAVSRWERDDCAPDIYLIPVLADIFGVTADELLRGEKSTEETPPVLSGKSERVTRHMIETTFTDFKIRSILSGLIGVTGIILTAVINYAFLRAYIAFGAYLIFFAVAAVCEIIFAIHALTAVNIEEESVKDMVEKRKKDILKTTYLIISFLFSLVTASVPLLFAGDAYFGLGIITWLVYGSLGFAVGIVISAIVSVFVQPFLLKTHGIPRSEKNIQNNRLIKKFIGMTLCVMLLTGILQIVIVSQGMDFFSLGTVFEDTESFKAFMEQPVERNDAESDPMTDHIANNDEDDIEESPEIIADEDGNILCSFVWRNGNVIQLSYDAISNNNVKIHVYTNEDYYKANGIKDAINICSVFVYLAEITAAVLIYRKKRVL